MRSPCPIACALDLLGDKWTLLVIRDLFMGKKTYGEFKDNRENIPTNILADRLKRLVSFGIVKKEQYQTRPPRYEYLLTDKGLALGPILKELVTWACGHLDGTQAQGPHSGEIIENLFKSPDQS